MFRSILVPLDGTPFGNRAVPLAVSIARRSGAELHLVRVHVPTVGNGATTPQQEQSFLEDVARGIRSHAPDVPTRTFVVDGAEAASVADALLGHVAANPADLIVLNSHARGGLSRWWSGNVADDLIHHNTIPVLAAPDLEHDPPWEPEPVLRHILVPLDGTPLAEQVLPAALTLGSCMAAEYTLLRVVEPVLVPVVDPACAPAASLDPALIDQQQESAAGYLNRVAARLRGNDARLVLHTHVLLDAEPAEAICGFLRRRVPHPGQVAGPDEERPIDAVALTTHGREGLARLLLGSIADRVLRHTPVPLLLQRPPGKTPESVHPDQAPADISAGRRRS